MSPSTTPATQSEGGGCHQVPHLPRKTNVNVTKRHACHANGRSLSPSATSATTQMEGKCHSVPRRPRETKVDVTKCHTCHAQYRGVIGDQARPSAPPEPAQCRKRHACHAKRRQMSQSATAASPATKRAHARAQPRAQPVPQAPRLPRKMKADVSV